MVVAQGKQDEPGVLNDLGESPKKGLFVGADFNDPKSSNNPYFDPQIFQDYKEEGVIRKVEEFKQSFLSMQEQAEQAEKDLAMSDIKIDELIRQSKELE